MKIELTSIRGVLIIEPSRLADHRGFFSETFRADILAEAGVNETWLQDNHAYSRPRGVLRGLHFQRPPVSQAKILRVTRGAILDVAVDIRRGSDTYGRHVAVELSADNWRQIYIPDGFAHGYLTLTEDVEVLYKVTAPYTPHAEGGLRYNDPALGIDWGLADAQLTLSDRDRKWPDFGAFESPFP